MITFSFRPISGSILPLIAASVRTFVVSWKDAADRNELVAREAAAKQELEERLQEFAEHWRKAGTDVTDSYALLPGSDRALWHQYWDDETQYVEDLIYEVQVR